MDRAPNSRNVEHPDDFDHSCVESAQQRNDRFVYQVESGFVESYINNRRYIAIRRAKHVTSPNSPQDGFLVMVHNGFGSVDHEPVREQHCGADDVGVRYDEPFMLEKMIELVEGPQGVIPSLVRAQRFDDRSFAIGQPMFAFLAVQPPIRIRSADSCIEDGEVRIAARLYAIAARERRGEHIETGAEKMDHRTGAHVEHPGHGRFFDRDDEIMIPRIRIALSAEGIWLTAYPSVECFVDNWDLGYGPIDGGVGV